MQAAWRRITMRYLSELRANMRPLIAASIGLGSGFALNSFATSLIAPLLLHEFGWSKAQFAIVSALGLLVVLFIPLAGRMTDVLGVRRTAAIGVVALPLTYVGLSLMTGDFRQYVAIYAIQSIFAIATTATVYSRVVAERFSAARGLALAIFASTPALIGALFSPLFNAFLTEFGWRAGYRALAVFVFAAGVVALLILPPRPAATLAARDTRRARHDYRAIAGNRNFWLLIVALLLCNMPQIIYLSQLQLLLLDKGVGTAAAALMLSGFAVGNIVGRFACGLCLDRFPMHIVATISMGLPCIGYFLLASGMNDVATLYAAVFVIALAFGAEGDLVAYIIARTFRIEIFSSVLGLMTASIGAAVAIGSTLLGITLKATGGYAMFLTICGWSVLVGGLLFLFTGRGRPQVSATGPEQPVSVP
jgi:MFS family permease